MPHHEQQADPPHRWQTLKERILLGGGLCLIAAEFVNAEVFGGTYHFEFLLCGLAMLGITIPQWHKP